MPSTPAQLTLTVDQKDSLVKLGIDSAKLYFVNNHDINTALPLDAYSSGHYLLFVEGTPKDHSTFFKSMYTTTFEPELKLLVEGLYAYCTPSAKFVQPENLVTVA